jgi:hypothetical protein
MLVLQLSWASCTFKTQIKFQDGTIGCLEELQIVDQIPAGESQKLSSLVNLSSSYVIARSINSACNALGIGTSRSSGSNTNFQSLSKLAVNACQASGCDCQPIISDGNVLISKGALFGSSPSTDKYDGQWRGTFSCTAYAGLERENPAFSYEIKDPTGNGINIERGLIEIEEQKKNAAGVPYQVVWKGRIRNGRAELEGEGTFPRSSYRMELKGAPVNDRTIKLNGPLSVGMSPVRECTITLESVKPAPGSLASMQEEAPPMATNTVPAQDKTVSSKSSSVANEQVSPLQKANQGLVTKSQQEADGKVKQESIALKAQQEAEAKAKAQQEAEAKARQEAVALKAQQEAEAKAKAKQEAIALKAQQEADAKAKQEADAKAKQEAVALKAQQEAEAKARAQQEAIAMKAQQDQAGKDRLRQEANDLKAKLEASMKMDSKARQVREPSAQVPRQQDAPSIGATQEAEVKSVPQIIAPVSKPSPTPKQGPIVVKSILDL